MELCEVLRFEIPDTHQCDGQRIAHDECGRRRTCRRQIQRAGFLLHPYLQMGGGVFCQQRFRMGAHADDGDVHVKDHRDEAKQFIRLTRIGQGKYYVVFRHYP